MSPARPGRKRRERGAAMQERIAKLRERAAGACGRIANDPRGNDPS
jgi:hypothetical protein